MKKFLFALFSLALAWPAFGQSPFRVEVPREAAPLSPGGQAYATVTIQIPERFFIYRDKTGLKLLDSEGIHVEAIQYPPSKTREDPFFKKKLEVFEGGLPIVVTLRAEGSLAPGVKSLTGFLKFQGCSDVLCYPEETHEIFFPLEIGLAAVSTLPSSSRLPLAGLLRVQNFDLLLERGWWVTLAVVFLGGVWTSFTPCVLPVIPVTLMIIGVKQKAHFWHNLFSSSILVLGLSLTYAALGVAAVFFGKGLGFVFQQKWFVLILALLFFLLALSMFGLFEIRLPQFLSGMLHHVKGHGVWGALASGMAVGVLAAPCAGPVIGALLLFVASRKNYLEGFTLLWVYALGMGLLFLVLGLSHGTLKARLRGGPWARIAKGVLGAGLLLVSLFYFNTVVPLEKVFTRWVFPSPVAWIDSEKEGLSIAGREGKWVLIDFYADWCTPCKELELGFFREPEVAFLLQRMVAVRVDATFTDTPQVQEVLKKYGVVGWPTVIFVNPEGRVARELTVVSYHPEKLLENIRRVAGEGKGP